MTSAQRRAREKAGTRERILAAARDLVVRHGFDAVSLRDIARAIDYTAPALYTHFRDKHDLLAALCDRDFGLLRDSMRATERIKDPVARLRAIGRRYVDFAFEHPNQYRFMFMEPWPADAPAIDGRPDGSIRHGDPDQDAYAFLKVAVAACIKAGRLRAEFRDTHIVTQVVWAAAHGVVSLFLTHGHDPWVSFKRPRATALKLVDAALRGMERNPRPRRAP
ncbi:MAG: TetR/AcrR family transcriptional regulator [Phycisphaerae bacterium]|nr:TetR/AcrR family transcriptional regulator [Phycisphaerae bacterium]